MSQVFYGKAAEAAWGRARSSGNAYPSGLGNTGDEQAEQPSGPSLDSVNAELGLE